MTYNQQLALIAELHNLSEDQTRQLDLQIHMEVLKNPVMTIYEFAEEIIRRTLKSKK